MDAPLVTRREALRRSALAGLAVPVMAALPSWARADEAPAAPPGCALTLGIATYSLRTLSVDAAIAALQALQVKSVSLFRTHLPILISTPDVCRELARKFRDGGLAIAGTGVVTLANDEGVMRRAFECARAAGLKTMTASYAQPPDRATFLLTERFVREYDIRLAFHNHGPEDAVFPSPYDVWTAVQPYDPRLGLCIDVGHSVRAGVDPTEAILKCRARLYDVHLKDSLAAAGSRHDRAVEMGFGRLDLRSILSALLQIHYPYQAGLEDEVAAADPVPGTAQSFGYLRGMLEVLSRPPPRP